MQPFLVAGGFNRRSGRLSVGRLLGPLLRNCSCLYGLLDGKASAKGSWLLRYQSASSFLLNRGGAGPAPGPRPHLSDLASAYFWSDQDRGRSGIVAILAWRICAGARPANSQRGAKVTNREMAALGRCASSGPDRASGSPLLPKDGDDMLVFNFKVWELGRMNGREPLTKLGRNLNVRRSMTILPEAKPIN